MYIEGLGNIPIPGESTSSDPAVNTQNGIDYENSQFKLNRQVFADSLNQLGITGPQQQQLLQQWDSSPNHDAAIAMANPYVIKAGANRGVEVQPGNWTQTAPGFTESMKDTALGPGVLTFAAIMAGMGGLAEGLAGTGLAGAGSSIGAATPSTFAVPDLLAASQLPGSSLMTALGTVGGGAAAVGAGAGAGLGATSIGGVTPSTFLDSLSMGNTAVGASPSTYLTPDLWGAASAPGSSLSTALSGIGEAGGAAAGGGTSASSLLNTPTSLIKNLSSQLFGKDNTLGNIWDIGTGLYGLSQAGESSKQTEANAAKADPFGQYRSGYAKQLQDLESDPTAIERLPQYQAGLNAIQRTAASSGYLGSGNEKLAASSFGANLYQSELQRLAGLAGAGINPGTSAQISQSGNQQGYQNIISALNRIGTGVLNF